MTEIIRILTSFQTGDLNRKNHVQATFYRFGRDFILSISGGETHLGTVALSDKRAGLDIFQKTLEGHREDRIANQAMELLSADLPGELLTVVGIHYDDISREQIDEINQNCEELILRIKGYIADTLRSGSEYQ